MKTIVLLSGGLDSTTALYWTLREGWDVTALTFDAQQVSRMDMQASRNIARQSGIATHKIIQLPFYDSFTVHPSIASSGQDKKQISVDYLPARNAIFYSIAAGFAESIGANQLISGSTQEDGLDLPDARSEFYTMLNQLLKLGTRSGVVGQPIHILTPLIDKGHHEILQIALDLKAPIELTWSCYNDDPPACGKCRSCQSRLSAFAQLGLTDPIVYAEQID